MYYCLLPLPPSLLPPLADSIPNNFGTNCALQQIFNTDLCCILIEGSSIFCAVQCVLPGDNNCICIDPNTGNVIEGLPAFPRPQVGDPNPIDCTDVLPTEGMKINN